jgi:hypothetical protein
MGYNLRLMGQVALGFRSLLVKGTVFFIMAALLAWALGGTLWPRAEVVDFPSVSFDARAWFWRLSVGGRDDGEIRWTLMYAQPLIQPFDDRVWQEVAGPIVADDALYYAGRPSVDAGWRIERIDADGEQSSYGMPDRLAVERQLARLAAGLPVQDAAVIASQRAAVLEPNPNPADPG